MTTRWRSLSIVVGLVFMLAVPGCTDFQSGVDAYNRGDYDTALKKFLPLANQGDAAAQYFLGGMYAQGKGVLRDYAEAMKWYRLVADQGVAAAQHNLGIISSQGQGVPKDDVQAYRWYTLAADQGNGSTHRRSPIWFKLTIPLKLMG